MPNPHPTLTLINLTSSSPIDITTLSTSVTSTGDSFSNNGNVIIIIRNTGVSSITATFTPINQQINLGETNQQNASVIALPIAAGNTLIYGPFWPANWNASNGFVYITYSPVPTSLVKILGIQLPTL